MNVHWLVGFATCFLVYEAGAEAFDLDARARFLLDVFYEHALSNQHIISPSQYVGKRKGTYGGSDDFCAYVEVPDALQRNRQLLLRPFSLQQ